MPQALSSVAGRTESTRDINLLKYIDEWSNVWYLICNGSQLTVQRLARSPKVYLGRTDKLQAGSEVDGLVKSPSTGRERVGSGLG